MADLTGPWLGSYWQAGNPTRFEATFVQARGSLRGRILDDSPLGEAHITGQMTGRQLTFTKQYFNNPSYAIQYIGTVSEDGDHISGRWMVNTKHGGEWEAHRGNDDLSLELKAVLSKTVTKLASAKN